MYSKLITIALVLAAAHRHAPADIIDTIAGKNTITAKSVTDADSSLTFTKADFDAHRNAITNLVAPKQLTKLSCRRSGYRAWSLGTLSLGGTQAVVERDVVMQLSKQPAGSGLQEAALFLNAYCLAKRTDAVELQLSVLGVCKKNQPLSIGKKWTHYRTPDQTDSFKITCVGYDTP